MTTLNHQIPYPKYLSHLYIHFYINEFLNIIIIIRILNITYDILWIILH